MKEENATKYKQINDHGMRKQKEFLLPVLYKPLGIYI